MKKYILIKLGNKDDLTFVVEEVDNYNNQNRMAFFKKYYDINKINNEGLLNALSDNLLEDLKKDALYYLKDNYRNKLSRSDKSNFPKDYFSIKKIFLDKEYLLEPDEDRLAILAIDLYNANIYAKENNITIEYKTAETKAEVSRIKF